MQLTIFVSDDDVRALRHLAGKECRSLHQEAKWLLRRAIKETAQKPQYAQATEAVECKYAPAAEVPHAAR